ncbi:MAG: MYXO-CTERM sorting domain-containing protein [Polyangiales bacterium]
MTGKSLSIALFFAAIVAVSPRTADAGCGPTFCPSYTTCRIAPFDAVNPAFSDLSATFDTIAAGPSKYGAAGWAYSTLIDDGVGKPHPTTKVSPRFPCSLLKGISVQESVGWHQFCIPTGPTCTGVSQTIISFDCGYGLMQVTSGMTAGATSAYDANRVASDPGYNVSVGAEILAEKWAATPSVGDNRVDLIEDWYFSVWAYNGLAFKNNPNDPAYPADRQPYRDTAGLSAGNYPYQELIWGWVRHPIAAPAGGDAYKAWPLSYPDRASICASCGAPTADIADPSPTHATDCPAGATTGGDAGVPTDAGAVDSGPKHDAATGDAIADATTSDATTSDAQAIDATESDAVTGDGTVEATGNSGGCGCRVDANESGKTDPFWTVATAALVFVTRRRRRAGA